MTHPALKPSVRLVGAIVAVAASLAGAAPVKTIGDLATWDPNHMDRLPKALGEVDADTLVLAQETLDVLPDMLDKMETVILNLTDEGNRARLAELYASVIPNAEKGIKAPSEPVRDFVIAQVVEQLGEAGVKFPLSKLYVLVESVEGGPAKEFVVNLKKQQGAQMPLGELISTLEGTPAEVRDFYRPTILSHLEHGHLGFFAGLFAEDKHGPWAIPMEELRKAAASKDEAVRKYVDHLPVWLAHHRIELEAPDLPIDQLLEMLAGARQSYAKTVDQPLKTEKDLQAPSKVAYSLQEAYARSEQIHMALIYRDVIGVMIVGTLLLLYSALRGYIKLLNVPNLRVIEKSGEA